MKTALITGITGQDGSFLAEFLLDKGYDVQFGARPLKRAIQSYIEDGVCERILSGEIKQGDTIKVDKADGSKELTFN